MPQDGTWPMNHDPLPLMEMSRTEDRSVLRCLDLCYFLFLWAPPWFPLPSDPGPCESQPVEIGPADELDVSCDTEPDKHPQNTSATLSAGLKATISATAGLSPVP